MIGSLYSGISGLKANTSAMSVIGDNIANVDTTGFKSSRVSFSNVFNASMGQSDMEIGRGVTMTGTNANWNSGTVETTNNVTDLAINGQGMFIVQDPADSAEYYTRAGQFEFDVNGYLVTQDGLRVQGNTLDPTGASLGLGDIVMPPDLNDPSATTEITMGLNLNANANIDAVLDYDDYDTIITTYDSLGNSIELNFSFEHTAADTWTFDVSSTNSAVTAVALAGNTLTFDSFGILTTAVDPAISLTLGNGADTPLDIVWNLTDSDITGYATNSVKTSQSQDGYPSGMLQGISVDEDGIFTGL